MQIFLNYGLIFVIWSLKPRRPFLEHEVCLVLRQSAISPAPDADYFFAAPQKRYAPFRDGGNSPGPWLVGGGGIADIEDRPQRDVCLFCAEWRPGSRH